jgi:hypothetical protein
MSTLGSYVEPDGDVWYAANGVEGGPLEFPADPVGVLVRVVSVVVNRATNTVQVSLLSDVNVIAQQSVPIPAGAIATGVLNSLQSFHGAFKATAFTTGVAIAPTDANLVTMAKQLIDF